ncbi:MAG TPA: MOSC domain-containing protein [Acidimicrobiales bacterium]|nr:MOSC domain-containing protein [Acidimicrobiales bacterium]
MPLIESLNVGTARAVGANSGMTGIDKLPTDGPLAVSAPDPARAGGSGLAGDIVFDTVHHGGPDQALYAYAREDLDWWEVEIGAPLRAGTFGENLTTSGLDLTGALIGECWRIGDDVRVQVTKPRIPCANFAVWMAEKGWLKTFTRRARPGAYLRILAPGAVRAGSEVVVESRPDHGVTIGRVFRALTLEKELLPGLLEAESYLTAAIRLRAEESRPRGAPAARG